MRSLVVLPSLLLSLTACAGATPAPGGEGQRVVGDERRVTVFGVPDNADARIVATKHCEQFGRSPQYVHTLQGPLGYEYLCVRT